jgi:hypothetical protein
MIRKNAQMSAAEITVLTRDGADEARALSRLPEAGLQQAGR